MNIKIAIYILLVLTAATQDNHLNFQTQILHTIPTYQAVTITSKLQARMLQPKVDQILIDKTFIFPKEMAADDSTCFGTRPLKISQGQVLIIKANSAFVVYFSTKTAYKYSALEEYYDKVQQNITLNFIVESARVEREQVVSIPLNIKCSSISRSFLRMKGNIHIDFLEQHDQKKYEFDFILICAGQEQIQEFNRIYQPGYIFFCVYFNLVLQVYHGYHRTRVHLTLFLLYLLGCMLITEQIVGYVFSLSVFILVVLIQKKEQNLNNKNFVLYNVLWFVNSLIIAFSYFTANSGYEWNSLQIAVQNIIKLHITMFLVLRLIKLPRFRYVFWYFVAVSIFAVLYQGNNNISFQINFRNPFDLTCFKAELFFGLMMLPICNYFSSITSWMHRVLGIVIAIACVLPLDMAIKLMSVSFLSVLCYEIKVKNMRIIHHQY